MTSRFFRGLGHLPVEDKEQFSQAAGPSSYKGGYDGGQKYGDPINCQPSPSRQGTLLPQTHCKTRKHGRTLVPTVSTYPSPRASHSPYLIALTCLYM